MFSGSATTSPFTPGRRFLRGCWYHNTLYTRITAANVDCTSTMPIYSIAGNDSTSPTITFGPELSDATQVWIRPIPEGQRLPPPPLKVKRPLPHPAPCRETLVLRPVRSVMLASPPPVYARSRLPRRTVEWKRNGKPQSRR